jgi:hypothetical protein
MEAEQEVYKPVLKIKGLDSYDIVKNRIILRRKFEKPEAMIYLCASHSMASNHA